MIWQRITRKKCQRQLQLIELLQKECYCVSELAAKIKVSSKTILRDLRELQQKNYVIKKKLWQINWPQQQTYERLYRKIILSDPYFQLFQQYLWQCGSKNTNYSQVKKLNQLLLEWNLSVNLQTGSLMGEKAVIIHLQIRYLRDFYPCNEAEIYQQVQEYHRFSSSNFLEKELFPNTKRLETFIKKFELLDLVASYFFLDYTRYHYQICSTFYLDHQRYQTNLYQEVSQALTIVEQVVDWEIQLTKTIFRTKLFELFLGIYQGLPLTISYYPLKEMKVAEIFCLLSKKMKQRLPILRNCRVDELAVVMHTIFSASHWSVLALNPELKSSLLIQERYQAFLPFSEGK